MFFIYFLHIIYSYFIIYKHIRLLPLYIPVVKDNNFKLVYKKTFCPLLFINLILIVCLLLFYLTEIIVKFIYLFWMYDISIFFLHIDDKRLCKRPSTNWPKNRWLWYKYVIITLLYKYFFFFKRWVNHLN